MKRWFAGAVLLVIALSACSAGGKPGAAASREIKLAPASALSPEIQRAPATVREAYRFAIANPELLEPIPCYCGCGSVGHTSNLHCYVKEVKADGSIVFDDHALG